MAHEKITGVLGTPSEFRRHNTDLLLTHWVCRYDLDQRPVRRAAQSPAIRTTSRYVVFARWMCFTRRGIAVSNRGCRAKKLRDSVRALSYGVLCPNHIHFVAVAHQETSAASQALLWNLVRKVA